VRERRLVAHCPQTAGCASNESERHYDLYDASRNHLKFNSNVTHGGLVQGFP